MAVSTDSDFEKFVKEYITRQDLVIQRLEDMKISMSSHHQKCNIAKTTGTAMSGTGVALVVGSVLMSPVTGGSSMIMGAGGAVMSVTGGLSNIITDYIDYKSSTMIMQDLQEIIKEKEAFDQSLQKQMENLQKIIDSFVKSGVDKDTAIVTAIKGIALGCIDLTEEPNNAIIDTLNKIMKLHHIEKVTLETLPIVGRTMHLSEKSFQFIYNVLGLTGKSAPHILQTLGRISSMVSIAFTVIDVALLVRDWTVEHPSVEVIQEVQNKLAQEKIILQDLLEVVEASRGTKDKMLIKVIEEIKIVEDEDDLLKDFEVFDDSELEDSKNNQKPDNTNHEIETLEASENTESKKSVDIRENVDMSNETDSVNEDSKNDQPKHTDEIANLDTADDEHETSKNVYFPKIAKEPISQSIIVQHNKRENVTMLQSAPPAKRIYPILLEFD